MKFGKTIVVIFLITFVSLFACGQDEGTTVGQSDQQQEGQPGAMPPETAQEGQPGAMPPETAESGQEATAEQVEIAGTVEQTADGVIIRSVNESYMVTGQDLSDMIGQDVRVMGTLEEADGRPTINVESVSVIE